MKRETVGREGAEPIPTVLSFNVYNTTMTGCGVELVDYVKVTDTVLWPRNRQRGTITKMKDGCRQTSVTLF